MRYSSGAGIHGGHELLVALRDRGGPSELWNPLRRGHALEGEPVVGSVSVWWLARSPFYLRADRLLPCALVWLVRGPD